ncbi:class I SAM-dependent methyltransferase [Roseibium algae]|uniref:Class I SAM-dependent methyltransferase n=1 Tax=Roseibium algae TaxID=3123038 RepID=A0ABU8TGG6_9HYPH
MTDPVLETLLLPIENGALELADSDTVLFLRARMDPALRQLNAGNLICEQSFAPDRDALERGGYKVVPEAPDAAATGFDVVLALPTRQKQEARALLARAVRKAKTGGIVLACAPNTEGAKTAEADLKALAGLAGNLSKNKCRVFWARISPDTVNDALVEEWLALDMPRDVLDGDYVSRPGLFAWDRVDAASKLLADALPATLAGKGADFGCGFGYLARTVLTRAPKVIAMDLYEAEKRALDLAQQNLSAFKGQKAMTCFWADVTKGVEGPYDFIVSNPPFHQMSKADRSDIGQGFIRAAAGGLRSGGVFYMVANRHLPYEQTLKDVFAHVEMIIDEGGYKVIRAIKRKGK